MRRARALIGPGAEETPDAGAPTTAGDGGGELTEAVRDAMVMPFHSSELPTDAVQRLADLAVDHGPSSSELDTAGLIR